MDHVKYSLCSLHIQHAQRQTRHTEACRVVSKPHSSHVAHFIAPTDSTLDTLSVHSVTHLQLILKVYPSRYFSELGSHRRAAPLCICLTYLGANTTHVQTASQSIPVSGDGISQLLVRSRAVLVRDSRVTHTSMASHDWTELAPVPSNNQRDAHGPS